MHVAYQQCNKFKKKITYRHNHQQQYGKEFLSLVYSGRIEEDSEETRQKFYQL